MFVYWHQEPKMCPVDCWVWKWSMDGVTEPCEGCVDWNSYLFGVLVYTLHRRTLWGAREFKIPWSQEGSLWQKQSAKRRQRCQFCVPQIPICHLTGLPKWSTSLAMKPQCGDGNETRWANYNNWPEGGRTMWILYAIIFFGAVFAALLK